MYLKIRNYNVFYSKDRFAVINKPFFENLSALEQIGMNIAWNGKPNKEALKLKKLQIEKLKEDFKKLGRQDFLEKWVLFDFTGKRAQSIIWDIIFDYFDIHKNGSIIKIGSLDPRIIHNYAPESYNQHHERICFEFLLSNYKNKVLNLINRARKLRTIIDINRIEKIQGSLNEFIIQTDNQMFLFSQNIEIVNIDLK